jgi:pimeloyl-ACP methyl ester carboxylesterase
MGKRVKASVGVLLLLISGAGSFAQPLGAIASDAVQPPACLDGTPHKRRLVPVDDGVQLEVLDWGGEDKRVAMVLLTGLGDNAHVFDQFAFQFIDHFHVIGITRRGFLPSSQPEPVPDHSGYDVDARARDVIAVLDFLGIRKAVFVGHSVAGSELSAIALRHKDYVEKLVYLDAFDLSERFRLPDIPGPPYAEADDRSLQILLAATQRLENTLRPAHAACFALTFDENGMITGDTTPTSVSAAILAGVQEPASSPTDWTNVEAPRLGIFSQPSVRGKLPYYAYLSAEDRKKFDKNWTAIVNWYRKTTNEFAIQHPGRPKPVVHRLPDATHYFYLNNDQAFVVRAMLEFLLGEAGSATAHGSLGD